MTLDEIRALMEAATNVGKWYVMHNERRTEYTVGCDDFLVARAARDDCNLIAAAVNYLRENADRIARLERVAEAVKHERKWRGDPYAGRRAEDAVNAALAALEDER